MKNRLMAVLFLGAVLILATASIGLADDYYSYYKHIELAIGDKEAVVNSDTRYMPQAAYVKGGRTLVPFRFLGESLGAVIGWDAEKKQARLTLGGNQVVVTVGSQAAYVNNKPVTLDIPAEVSNGSLFVPLRFMRESLGAAIDYDPDLQLITVDSINTADWEWYSTPVTGIKYKHPRDWKVSTEEDGKIVIFTSPNDSELYLYLVTGSPQDNYEGAKKNAEDNGWAFEWEEFNVPEDLNQGYDLVYSSYDEENDYSQWYICYVEKLDDEFSLVVELTVYEDYFYMDRNIASAIFNSQQHS